MRSDTQENAATEVTNLEVGRGEGFVELYANYLSCAITAQDFTLMFGRTVVDNPQATRIEQHAVVALSLQTTKVLANMLVQNLRRYEAEYGEIRLDPLPTQGNADEGGDTPAQVRGGRKARERRRA